MEDLKDLHRKEHQITETSQVNIKELQLVSKTILGVLRVKTKASFSMDIPLNRRKNRKDRIRMFQENLAKFKDGTLSLGKVVTGNEVWLY